MKNNTASAAGTWKDRLWSGNQGTPNCPRCQISMVYRRGRLGPFWGCSNYPRCTAAIVISSDAPKPKYAPIVKLPGTDEQELIWRQCKRSKKHLVTEAFAGTGKTWTQIQFALRNPEKKIAYIAFNKHNADEASEKLRVSGCKNVSCRTSNSFGYWILRTAFPGVEFAKKDRARTFLYTIEASSSSEFGFNLQDTPQRSIAQQWQEVREVAVKLVNLSKSYFLGHRDSDFLGQLQGVVDHHQLEMQYPLEHLATLVSYVMESLIPTKEQRKLGKFEINYSDQVWLPLALNLTCPKAYDYVIVDEAQDQARSNQELVRIIAGDTAKIIIVGDRYQAIYGFRGADTLSIQRMTDQLAATKRGVETLSLTITQRCNQSGVALAQCLVPNIKARLDAPVGQILCTSGDSAIDLMEPGDLVLCRVNRPLVPTAYKLMRAGKRVVVKGGTLGEDLLDLISFIQSEFNASTLQSFMQSLTAYYQEQRSILLEDMEESPEKGGSRLQRLEDNCDCLREMIAGSGARSVEELKRKVDALFSETDEQGETAPVVTLGTVHRTKGLEATRVFILAPELMPHPRSVADWEVEAERNLAYVAATRVKFTKENEGSIIFCGSVPAIFKGLDPKFVKWYIPNAPEVAASNAEELETSEMEDNWADLCSVNVLLEQDPEYREVNYV